MAHTFDPANAARLEDPGRYRFCSREELVDLIDVGGDGVVADLGSGTGFYATDLAHYVDTLYGVDVQPEMHSKFLEKGVPDAVRLVTAEVAAFPFADESLDAAYSTMTLHEFAGTGAIADVARALRPGGRFVAVDWSAAGEGETGPPRAERRDLESAVDLVEAAGLDVVVGRERPETFALAAVRPA